MILEAVESLLQFSPDRREVLEEFRDLLNVPPVLPELESECLRGHPEEERFGVVQKRHRESENLRPVEVHRVVVLERFQSSCEPVELVEERVLFVFIHSLEFAPLIVF